MGSEIVLACGPKNKLEERAVIKARATMGMNWGVGGDDVKGRFRIRLGGRLSRTWYIGFVTLSIWGHRLLILYLIET